MTDCSFLTSNLLLTIACTYTQVVTDKNGEGLDAARHGLNRDAVRVGLIGSQIGVVAVADGCGLTYWSEIAAHIAVNEFMLIVEKRLASEHPPYAPGAMRTFLREAIHSVNQSMLSWKHPKLKSKCNVLDKGGNTTLVVAIIFPYVDDDTTTVSAEAHKADDSTHHASSPSPSSSSTTVNDHGTQQHSKSPETPAPSSAKAPSRKLSAGSRHSDGERKFGVVFTGMGDSELYLFKVHEPERPARGKGSSTAILPPTSSATGSGLAASPSHHSDDSDTHNKPGHVRAGTGDSSSSAGGSVSESPLKSSQSNLENPATSSKSKHLKTSSKDVKKPNKFFSALANGLSPSKPSSSSSSSTHTPAVAPTEASSSNSTHNGNGDTRAPLEPQGSFVQRRAGSVGAESAASPRSSASPGTSPRAEGEGFVSVDPPISPRDSKSPRGTGPEIGHQRDLVAGPQEPSTELESTPPLPSHHQQHETQPLQPPHDQMTTNTDDDELLITAPTLTPLADGEPTSESSIASKTSEEVATSQTESNHKKLVTRSAPARSVGHASPSASAPHGSSLTELPEDDFDDDSSASSSRPLHSSMQRDFSNTSIDSTSKTRKKRSSTSSKTTTSKASEKSRSRGSSPPRRQSPPRSLASPIRSLSKDDTSIQGERKGKALEASDTVGKSSTANPQDPVAETTPTRAPRSARYSKSYSDIPSFESLDQDLPAPMYRSESLAIDIDSARRVQASDDASHADAKLSSSPGSATPRAPCGMWLKLLSDSGRSPFLPFPGLRDRSIPEPSFIALNPGDSIFACSDGVLSSYPDGIQWPDISVEQYDCKDGVEYATQALINSTMSHHRLSHTDPDDVTVGAIKLTMHAKKRKSDALRVSPVRDLTSTFAPQFASSTYHREYLNDFLCEYPKPKDKSS